MKTKNIFPILGDHIYYPLLITNYNSEYIQNICTLYYGFHSYISIFIYHNRSSNLFQFSDNNFIIETKDWKIMDLFIRKYMLTFNPHMLESNLELF